MSDPVAEVTVIVRTVYRPPNSLPVLVLSHDGKAATPGWCRDCARTALEDTAILQLDEITGDKAPCPSPRRHRTHAGRTLTAVEAGQRPDAARYARPMTIDLPNPDQLRRTGSLKWTGILTADGRPTLGAWVAEMDFGTAPPVAQAMKQAIDDGLLGYQPTWLAPRVAEALAEFEHRRFGWDLPTDDIRLVGSVLPALIATMDHLIRPGAPVIVPTPAYMPFLTLPEQHGHPIIQVPSTRERGWSLDLDGIRAGLEQGAGLVILCQPWNPTGRVLSDGELADVRDLVANYDALVFADEIHSSLVLDDPGAFTSYRARYRRAGSAGAGADVKICGACTAVSPVGNLCPARRGAESFRVVGLGRCLLPAAVTT